MIHLHHLVTPMPYAVLRAAARMVPLKTWWLYIMAVDRGGFPSVLKNYCLNLMSPSFAFKPTSEEDARSPLVDFTILLSR